MLQPTPPQISRRYRNPSPRLRHCSAECGLLSASALEARYFPKICIDDLFSSRNKGKKRRAVDVKDESLKEVKALTKELVLRNKRFVSQRSDQHQVLA